MNWRKISSVMVQAAKPSRFGVMAKKALKRILDRTGKHSGTENLAWLRQNSMDFADYARTVNADLWREAEEVSADLQRHAEAVLKTVDYSFGAAAYPFLYFITRLRQPEVIVETGVAAGFSSYAFLAAIARNGRGALFSSDFPYFRLPNPERLIGIVVEERLKANWRLWIDGDEANLPRILAEAGRIDLFHYDSDKSYSGREFAMGVVGPVLSEDAIIIMDDIADNSWFYDYVAAEQPASWRIFEFGAGRYVGVIGELAAGQYGR